ncbi:N1R/p28-like protein [Adoxophyes honmai entomopoxvirus 'L']|uniref:N1R/p28-like protein n=1 Tax=Adoxophyes honmai entomopoxvirus 'L' TaxID=1293540 RepID=A0A916KPF1_9POXV|nr:N1R/p28-like protein [Adoxophyes honmai entomopoxvirus 'L']YP_008004069.1 N1R/p28-like protein [Adoxophyes honmai entomopoxvirus 'L']CCU55323.1 N1R/p28-like protein [Adoxophyes honmai entomopoxvirus 'L']CCU55567.1 N1R/p28-like protein [Adoxophyes honmai entomopoxvirus 'L']
MSLIDICYEQIKDQYYYGLFGEFRLIIDKNTGYFNATKLCKDAGVKLTRWLESEKSKELIKYYNNFLLSDNPGGLIIDKKDVSIYVINVQGNKINNTISGTYVYKKLLLDIASWISIEFYDKCSNIIEKYYIDEYTKEYKDNKNKLQNKIKKIEKTIEDKNNVITSLENSNKELNNSIKDLNISNNKLNETLTSIKPKIITPPPNNNKYSTFTIIKLYNEIKENDYNYYITTVCERDYDIKINNLINIYPNLSIVLKLIKVPNAKYLLDTIKNNTIDDVDYNKNKFNLKEINIHEYIDTVMEIKGIHRMNKKYIFIKCCKIIIKYHKYIIFL